MHSHQLEGDERVQPFCKVLHLKIEALKTTGGFVTIVTEESTQHSGTCMSRQWMITD